MIEAIAITGKPDAAKKRCYDCLFCKAATSWWCMNQDAINARNTNIPGVHSCRFWEPMRTLSDLTRKETRIMKSTHGFFKFMGIHLNDSSH